MLERICYSYQAHECPSLGVWKALDRLAKNIQPKEVEEAKHYGPVKTLVEVCKAGEVNLAAIYTRNIDTTMKILYDRKRN